MKKTLVALVVLAALPLVAAAQKPVTQTEAVEISAKIEAIDQTSRMITLKDTKDGSIETLHAGPEVKRFSELKVGDTVTFRYYESIAYEIRKPGQAATPKSSEPKLTRAEGAKPGGTISQQETAVVVVKAIDLAVPSITVTTDDNRTVSFKVDNKKNLDGVKVGDKVEVTYTQALLISVK